MTENPLGKKTIYKATYDPSLLFKIPRESERAANNVKPSIFSGYDAWTCYELSWLNQKGRPEARIALITYPSDTKFIVESKSLKLYLNTYIMTRFDDEKAVSDRIKSDLEKLLETSKVTVVIKRSGDIHKFSSIPEHLLLDNLDITIDTYQTDEKLLKTIHERALDKEHYSNLLKSNCPITGQPDWATIYIKYCAEISIKESSLLRYIVSYREHGGYHESCCEKIFTDIHALIKPSQLIVKCFYTRRGGIDINPVRYTVGAVDKSHDINALHYWRQ